jgi:hypothetical protein
MKNGSCACGLTPNSYSDCRISTKPAHTGDRVSSFDHTGPSILAVADAASAASGSAASTTGNSIVETLRTRTGSNAQAAALPTPDRPEQQHFAGNGHKSAAMATPSRARARLRETPCTGIGVERGCGGGLSRPTHGASIIVASRICDNALAEAVNG